VALIVGGIGIAHRLGPAHLAGQFRRKAFRRRRDLQHLATEGGSGAGVARRRKMVGLHHQPAQMTRIQS
jgi:hypothetical protein